jgi:hypothetical protein
MVSEPLDFGVPVLVRRAPCASNHVVPGVVIVDGFDDLDGDRFRSAVAAARGRVGELRRHAQEHHGLAVVRELTLRTLRAATPISLRQDFDRLAQSADEITQLDEAAVY